VTIEDDYSQWAEDGLVLAQVGRALFPQRLKVQVRIPRQLADQAIASWERDDSGAHLPSPEPSEQAAIRDRGATLSLIGLSVQQGGIEDGEDVVVDLDAWYIGNALNAAEQEGLLTDVRPPPPDLP
jgi:hypothetical protein